MQKEFTKPGPVLDEHGHPFAGYSTKSVLTYDRKAIKAKPWRIKEWDFYQVTNKRLCLQFTIGHAAYAGQVSMMLFDFEKGKKLLDKNKFLILPFNSLHMPTDAERDHVLCYDKGGVYMKFTVSGDVRKIHCRWGDIETKITMRRQNPNAMVINLPFDESDTAFYYNHKINCMTAAGYVQQGNHTWNFDGKDSFGLLDWGRGVWPFHNEWYWSNGSGYIDGKMFGFNLGCGFGNTDTATENMIFYDGKAHKLGKVKFTLGSTYMRPWHLTDDEGRLDLTLTPKYDRTTQIKLLWVDNCCHQMFGEFRGHVILDDGTRLEIKNVISFAEHAVNQW